MAGMYIGIAVKVEVIMRSVFTALLSLTLTCAVSGFALAQGVPIKPVVAAYGAGSHGFDATIAMQQQCVGKTGSCEFSCSNETMGGDPAKGLSKECRVAWKCGQKLFFDEFPESSAKQTLTCE